MSEQDIKDIFTKNLNFFLNLHDKTQLDLAKYLKLSNTSVNNWFKGYNMPRMDKVDKICEFFNIKRSDLLEDKSKEQSENYYTSPETQSIAQQIFEDKELRLLFDAAKDASPEDLKTVQTMLKALKEKEQHD